MLFVVKVADLINTIHDGSGHLDFQVFQQVLRGAALNCDIVRRNRHNEGRTVEGDEATLRLKTRRIFSSIPF